MAREDGGVQEQPDRLAEGVSPTIDETTERVSEQCCSFDLERDVRHPCVNVEFWTLRSGAFRHGVPELRQENNDDCIQERHV